MFDPVGICRILNEAGVEFVVVGGFASVIHGSSLPTQDIDVVPSRQSSNLDRLAAALRRMNAMIRTSDEPVAARIDGRFLENLPLMLNLVTDLGDVDLTFAPSGGLGGFVEWDAHALTVEIARRGDRAGRGARRRHPVEASREPAQGSGRPALPRIIA